jgi:hypothetical protein
MFVFLVACCTVVVLAKVFTGAAVIGSDYELPTTIYNLTYDTTKPLYHVGSKHFLMNPSSHESPIVTRTVESQRVKIR